MLQLILDDEGYATCIVRDGVAAISQFADAPPDLVILDYGLPDRDGIEVVRSIRRKDRTPILILTARDGVEDKVAGLDAGADDYMTKPVDPRELTARVRSLLRRRCPAATGPAKLAHGPLVIDVESRRLTRGETEIELTRVEFDLLVAMMRRPGEVVTRETLLEAAWGGRIANYRRTIDTHICRLRNKIEPDQDGPRFIHSVRGRGYRLEYAPG